MAVAGVTYINLDNRPDRRAHMEALLADCPWPHRRFAAIRLTEPPQKLGIRMRDKVRGAMAVASIWQSHQGALAGFLDSAEDGHFVLLEDDVQIEPAFWGDLPAFFGQLPADWRMLMVSSRYRERGVPASAGAGPRKRFVAAPAGPRPQPLKPLAATHFCTGAHFCMFRDKGAVRAILDEMAACREIHDVDVFYANLEGTYGVPNRRVSAGGFGSDHI